MWNINTCNFEDGQANVCLNVDDFPHQAASKNYKVIFNVSLQVNGVTDSCHLYLQVDNVTVSQGEVRAQACPYSMICKNLCL